MINKRFNWIKRLFTMISLKCLPIFGIIIASAFCNSTIPTATLELEYGLVKNATANMTEKTVTTVKIPIDIQSTTITNNNTNITSNVTTRPEGKRRTVLIINSPSLLRQDRGRKKTKGKKEKGNPNGAVKNLLYVEYNEDGSVVAEYMMHNMEDVSRFFESFLHTELCVGKC